MTPAESSAILVVQRLQTAGHVAYWAGGCVRDRLLGRVPVDYDVATAAHPDQVQALFPCHKAVGQAFGVVLVREQDAEIEVATFRTERDYHDGRHPGTVRFATAEEDAWRRDFTVNAMFHDPVAGRLHDFVGGQADLAARCIRCVGDPAARFAEDALRLLRAVRLAETLGFHLDPGTAAAIRAHAPDCRRLAPERIRDELDRILLEAVRPGAAFELLESLGLLAVVLPEVAALRRQAQPSDKHPEGDVLAHTLRMLDLLPAPRSRELALAVLLHDIAKPATATVENGRLRFFNHAERGAELAGDILRRLRHAHDTVTRVCMCVRNHSRFSEVFNMRRATLRRWIGAPTFPLELELHRLDRLGGNGQLDHYRFLVEFVARLATTPALPPRLIGGRDVLALGIPPGPAVKEWLHRAYDAQLDGELTSRADALAWLARAVAAGGA